MLRKISFLIFALLSANLLFAQSGALKGTITDSRTGEPIPFANVAVLLNATLVTGGMTDFDGKYTIKPISAGTYTVKASCVGLSSQQFNEVLIKADKIRFLDFKLSTSAELIGEVEIIRYVIPLIDKDNTQTGATVTSEDIEKMPGRSISSVVTTVAGVYSTDGEVGSIRGARSGGTVYFVDGVKVRGSASIPKSAMEQVSVITGGISAKYGDVTGGIISITTKGPSNKFYGGIEYVTSQFLDPYGYNLLEFNVSGPLVFKKEQDPNNPDIIKKVPVAGYFLSTSLSYIKDSDPSCHGMWKVNDDTLNYIIENPIRPSEGGLITNLNSDYLQDNSFEKIDAKQNIDRYNVNIAGKIDVKPSKNINITLGGTVDYINRHDFSYAYSLFNWENNPQVIYTNWRAYARLTQKFSSQSADEQEKAASNIKNAYYRIQIDYSKTDQTTQDDSHKDNLFNYGYIGKFNTYMTNSYAWNDTVTGFSSGAWVHDGFWEYYYDFEPSDINPEASAVTEYYYSLYDPWSWHYMNSEIVELSGGLLNGQSPQSVYGLWNSPGTQYNGYSIGDYAQFRVSAAGSADIKDHEVSIGFEFEQRNDRYFGAAPVGLWTVARQLMNNHIQELDVSNPHAEYDDYGAFQDTINYDRLYNPITQAMFDINFREHLGMPIDGLEWIDIDSYDPSEFSIDYFSADELLNNGNYLVAYYGYDHHGNRLTHKPSFEDFFIAKDENGRYKREVAPFEPNYSAAYIQDKFSFRDLVFNVGLRVDRFDANQMVLKDQYCLYETYKAGDVNNLGEHPGNIGNDYVVYVDNMNDPDAIVGYRNGDVWYLADGSETNDPTMLYTGTGITPYLVDPNADLGPEGFEDYEPQFTVMPRISFSFPISDVALFFAHYDILSKRPSGYARLNPADYLFITSVASEPINNPNLKPERTIDYELGFQQKLNNTSSLKLSAFYRNMQDMIQIRNIVGAYPIKYMTYANIDFGTVKGLTVTYDLRRTGNVSMRASYTLQFANGTGSDAETAMNLIKTGQPNLRVTLPLNFDQRHAIVATLDYRFASGKNYDGPKWFGKDIFENTGANFVLNMGSGSPYTKRDVNTDYVIGSINGSRKPWRYTIDSRIDRDILIKWGRGADDNKKTAMLNVYLVINNLLNAKNILSVYSTTGNPDDDGYLTAAKNQISIQTQNDELAYRNYYTMMMNNPGHYSMPRTIRLGAMLNF